MQRYIQPEDGRSSMTSTDFNLSLNDSKNAVTNDCEDSVSYCFMTVNMLTLIPVVYFQFFEVTLYWFLKFCTKNWCK